MTTGSVQWAGLRREKLIEVTSLKITLRAIACACRDRYLPDGYLTGATGHVSKWTNHPWTDFSRTRSRKLEQNVLGSVPTKEVYVNHL